MTVAANSCASAVELRARVEQKTAVLGIMGPGYDDLPPERSVHNVGDRVVGFDVDEARITMLAHDED